MLRFREILVCVLVVLPPLAWLACGGGDGVTGPTVASVASVVVAPGDTIAVSIGETIRFTAMARDASGNTLSGRTVTWSSSNPAVATVDGTGNVTAVADGSTEIRATSEGRTGSGTVRVQQRVASVHVSAEKNPLTAIGESTGLAAEPRDALGHAAPGRQITWTSRHPEIATVDALGRVTALANGSAVMSAAADGVEGTLVLGVAQVGAGVLVVTPPAGARAGIPFEQQPVLDVVDANGVRLAPGASATVTATLTGGGGTLLGMVTAPVTDGRATFGDLAIGGLAGTKTLSFAVSGGTPTSATLDLSAGRASVLRSSSGDGQTGLAATPLSQPLVVRVTDDWENGVADITVDWTVTEGEGSVSTPSGPTGADGSVSTGYTLGLHAGVEHVGAASAALEGQSPAFTLTATPNATIRGTVGLTGGLLSMQAPRPGATVRATPNAKLSATGVVESSTSAPASHRPEFVPDRLFVRLKPAAVGFQGVPQAATASGGREIAERVRAVLAGSGRIGRVGSVAPVLRGAQLHVPADVEPGEVIRRLRADPRVESVERVPLAWADATPVSEMRPTDPYSFRQAWHYAMIDLPHTWPLTTGSSAVTVAVVDDGIRFDHPDVAPQLTSDGYDFVSYSLLPTCTGGTIDAGGDGDGWDSDPTIPVAGHMDPLTGCFAPASAGNHGLHVAGTIGAKAGDAYGGTGVAWNVRIRPVRVLSVGGSGAMDDIAFGVVYAAGYAIEVEPGVVIQAQGPARVINMSLGGPSDSQFLHDAVTLATAAGSLVIASAGNDAATTPNYPAAYPEVVSVAALGPDGQPASYTNLAGSVDILAPGGDIGDGGADFGVYSTYWNFDAQAPAWAWLQGTSMAAPHVSGVAALVLAASPGLGVEQLRSRLLDYSAGGVLNARNSVTATLGTWGTSYVRLYDAGTGDLLRAGETAAGGDYEFRELPDGDYFLFAGLDYEGDGRIGEPVRPFGAFGGSARPAATTVDGAAEHVVTFDIGYPFEQEGNGTITEANVIPLDGYQMGFVDGAFGDYDVFQVRVPSPTTLTFETRPISGACGFALEEDTVLELLDATGSLLASNDDIDLGHENYCSRVRVGLSAGTYYVRITGFLGRPSRYSVRAWRE